MVKKLNPYEISSFDPLLKLFREKGEKRVHKNGEPFSMVRKGTVFAFEQDPLNLFAVPKVESKEASRHFLAKYDHPLFFSFWENSAEAAYDIVAISEGETISYELREELLEELLTQEMHSAFAILLNAWVIALSSYFSKPLHQRFTKSIFPNESVILEPQEILIYKQFSQLKKEDEAIWVEVLNGKIDLFDERDLQITAQEQFFPMAYPIWISCSEKARITGVDTLTLVQSKNWRKGANIFASIFNRYFSLFFNLRKEEEIQLLEDRNDEQKSSFEIAVMQMESVLKGPQTTFIKQTKNPLQEALQYLGNHLGIEFIFPRTVDFTNDIEEKINLICDASQIQKRKVCLEANWWKKDNGALLGFRGEDNQPVVLINSVFSNYQTVDQSKMKKRVTKGTAAQFAKSAFMFYPPLPPHITKGREIISFFGKRHFKLISSVLGYSFIGSIIAFFPPIATKLFFRYAIPEHNDNLIFYLSLGLIFSSFGFIYFYFLRNLSSLKLEGLSAHMVQSALWDRLLKLSPEFFRKYSIGDLYWRATSVEEIRGIITANAATLNLAGLFSLLYLFIMGVFSPILMLTVVGFIIIGVLATWFAAHFKVKILRESLEIQGKLRGIVIQMITGIGKLRVAGAEKSAFSYWAYFFSKHKFLQSKIHKIQTRFFSFSTALPLFCICGVYAVTIKGIGIKGISISDFLAFNVAFGSLLTVLGPLGPVFMQLVNIKPLWERTKPILLEPMEEQIEKADPGELSGEIFVDGVVFGYDPSHPPVLNGISMEIQPRKLIGIVGPSGSGKSTLLRVLLGFEKIQSGAVYYNGKDLASLDPRAVRRQIGAVLQGQGIMAGSLFDNIICGGIYTKEQIRRALALSGFDQDLDLFPMKLNTYVPMGAETLSGGQRQRLLLARALLSNPAILILDEATSALDNLSQKVFTEHINSLNVTRVVVAQRLSTLRTADMIYVIEKGMITQKGSFEELSQLPGFFSAMVSRQKI